MIESNEKIGGYSIDELAQLSPDQMQEVLEKAIESEEDYNRIIEAINGYEEQLEDYEEELNDIQNGRNVTDESKEEAEELLDAVDELLENMEQLTDEAEFAYDDYKKRNVDASEIDSLNVSSESVELDGTTYTYTLGGGTTNPFETDEEDDSTWLVDEGITNEAGEVLRDVNADGFLNYDDVEKALEEKNDPLSKQSLFLTDYNYTLVSFDEEKSVATFKVTDPDHPEDFAYVTFENTENVSFFFESGITSEDITSGKLDTWPSALLKNCFWEDDEKSFYDHLHADEETGEITTRLTAIENYDDVRNAAESIVTQYPPEDQGRVAYRHASYVEIYPEVVDIIYSNLDDPENKTSEAVWEEVVTHLKGKGYPDPFIQNMLQYLVLGITQNDPQKLPTLIEGPAIGFIENWLTKDTGNGAPISSRDILVLTILENHCGPGSYNGIWMGAGFPSETYPDAPFNNSADNQKALEEYMRLLGQTGLSIPTEATLALDYAKGITDQANDPDVNTDNDALISLTDQLYKNLLNSAQSYADILGSESYDGVTKNKLREDLIIVINDIKNAGEIPAEEMAALITSSIRGLPSAHQDDAAAALSFMLKEKANDLWKALNKTDTWKSTMWSIMDNGDHRPGAGSKYDLKALEKLYNKKF